VFRLFLEALANPGRILSLGRHSAGFLRHGQWLAPAVTLLDTETGFFWDGAPEVGGEIRFLTGGAAVSPEEADFVFLSQKTEPRRMLSRVKRGTYTDPHDSALLLVAVRDGLERPLKLKGPGVPPEGRDVSFFPEEFSWLQAREEQDFEYPCGVELIFLREDFSFLAITRKAAVIWPM
jgi:alpha-D-ribose 1-methylphosphonate 5-triphosphate synthase subunit PhnH